MVVITAKYARHTKELVNHTEKSVQEASRSVDEAIRLADDERQQRKKLAFQSLQIEIKENIAACERVGRELRPVHLPTQIWDTLKGELAFLPSADLENIHRTYRHIRLCNMFCECNIVFAGKNNTEGDWQNHAKQLPEVAESIDKRLQELMTTGLDELLAPSVERTVEVNKEAKPE